MSSIFLSNIPKESTIEAVESFLRGAFPTATKLNVLRGSSCSTNKGHAYVHFASAEEATAAVEQYSGSNLPPVFLEKSLRMRVCRSGIVANEDHSLQARKRGREEVPCDAKSWEGLPLPGHCARYPHFCCAYYCRSPIHDSVNGSDATSVSSVLGVEVAACVSLGMTGDGMVEQEVVVVVFSSEWNREKAVKEHGLARCGPPVLEDLLTRPRSLEEHWSRHGVTQSQMNAVPDISEKLAHLCDNGFKLLGPSEALEEVRELLDGHGRIAVKDKKGSLAVLRVPTYVASLE